VKSQGPLFQQPSFRERARFVVLALATIAVGLVVHLRGTILAPLVRDALGDALWAMMVALWVAAAAPRARRWRRGSAALALCWAVEISQLYHAQTLDAWRRTTVGHLVLGSDFDARDLGAYAVGVLAAVLLETLMRRGAAVARAVGSR
jgi:hypothetical protein